MGIQTRYAVKDALMAYNLSTNANGWNGKDNHLPVGVSSTGSPYLKYRSVVGFNIDFSPMDSISSAYLRLYNNGDGSNLHTKRTGAGIQADIVIARMTKDWAELSATPEEGLFSENLTYDWNNRYDAFTSTNQSAYSNFTQPANNTSYIDVNVTDIVTDWFNGANNYGFMIYNTREGQGAQTAAQASAYGVQFYSRSATDSSKIPSLTINYITNTAPSAPTLSGPGIGTIVSDTTPSLSGSSNDADEGDYITSVAARVREAKYRYRYSNLGITGDPGSGYLRYDSPSNRVAISKTDLDGKILDLSDVVSSISIDKISDNFSSEYAVYFYRWYATSVDASSYLILDYGFDGNSGNAISNNDEVYIFPYYQYVWDSGRINVANRPTTFSILYGSGGNVAQPLVSGRTYKWQANTADKSLAVSPWSVPTYFKVNSVPNAPQITILSLPVNDIKTLTPSIKVTHSDPDSSDYQMSGYELIIEKEQTLNSNTWSSTGGWLPGIATVSPAAASETVTVAVSLEPGFRYRVRARTKDAYGAFGPYSDWQIFAIHKTDTPIISSPAENTRTSTVPKFSASRPASSSDYINAYNIYLETVPAGVSPVLSNYYSSGITNGSSFSISSPVTLTNNQAYRWKTSIGTASSGYSEQSSWAYFSVDGASPYITSPTGSGYTVTPSIGVQAGSSPSTFTKMQYEIYPSTSTDANPGSYIYASPEISLTSASSYSVTYGGSPALQYKTSYQVRARVYNATWSAWSGMTGFSTETAAGPTLTSVDGVANNTNPWIITTQPAFVIGTSSSMTYAQVQVLDAQDNSISWDSGLVSASGTSATVSMSGTSSFLTQGKTYSWRALYKDSSDRTSEYTTSDTYKFRVNAPPNVPSSISINGTTLTNGGIYAATSGLKPTFSAQFSDDDIQEKGDYPSSWYIAIETGGPSWSTAYVKAIPMPANWLTPYYYSWGASDYAFVLNGNYQWRTYFKDSNGVTGAYSQSFGLTFSTSPYGHWANENDPNGSTINTIESTKRPTVSWIFDNTGTYAGQVQASATIQIVEVDSIGNVISGARSGTYPEKNVTVYGTSQSYTFPDNTFFDNNRYFRLGLRVTNTAGLESSPNYISYYYFKVALDAPAAITGISNVTSTDNSSVKLEWNASTVGNKFVAYKIYRRVKNDTYWNVIAYIKNVLTNYYVDWYAGNGVTYEYKVNQLATTGAGGAELESIDGDDSKTVAKIDADVWTFIPYDRNTSYQQELPVIDSSYNKVIQQESFETLGSTRKTVIRGFVLGDEGNITCVWKNEDVEWPENSNKFYNETVLGRRLLEYVSSVKGPHILKSPFGDVWDVQFEGPEIAWAGGGILQASISWVETGTAGEDSI